MTPVYQVMHRWSVEPFQWGVNDCCLSLADWYHMIHGKDPAAHLRGTYHDMASCMRTGWLRDPVSVVDGCLRTVGGHDKVGEPKVGDVSVIMLPREGGVYPAGALWLGNAWGCKGLDGATTLNPRMTQPLAVWDIGYAA